MTSEMKKIIACLVFSAVFAAASVACGVVPAGKLEASGEFESMDEASVEGPTVSERFDAPAGFSRIGANQDSFAHYLRNLPLRPHGSRVYTYDGRAKFNSSAYEAVVDMDIGERDLQQCADAVMRLRGEYQFAEGLFGEISFKLTNGFEVPYSKWRDGWRVRVEGNETSWVRSAEPDESYDAFRKYMEFVFIYAGTLSLERDLEPVPFTDMEIGDVLVQGGSPGHAVIVVDMAENPDTGEKVFMLAQSYMPAQDIHVLSNPNDEDLSPWYATNFEEELRTPEWTFKKVDLKGF